MKFGFLADLQDRSAAAMTSFDACDNLGAVNLRGTGAVAACSPGAGSTMSGNASRFDAIMFILTGDV